MSGTESFVKTHRKNNTRPKAYFGPIFSDRKEGETETSTASQLRDTAETRTLSTGAGPGSMAGETKLSGTYSTDS